MVGARCMVVEESGEDDAHRAGEHDDGDEEKHEELGDVPKYLDQEVADRTKLERSADRPGPRESRTA